MRFMVMHKVDRVMEAGQRPSQEVISGMGKLIGRMLKAGVFLDGAGLHPSAQRARLTIADGNRTVQRGPYDGGNELLASFALITAKSLDHAIELAGRLVEGDGEVEIGPVVEAWDLNGKARPADAPYRYLLLRKADAAFERGAGLPTTVQAVLDEWQADGTLQSAATLVPSAQGVRYQASGGKRTWIDGPFAESKELVAGFSIIEVPSLAEAKTFTEEYGSILGDNQVDIRVVS